MATFVSLATCHNYNNTSRHPAGNREYLMGFSQSFCIPNSASKHWTTGRNLQPVYRGRSPFRKSATTEKPSCSLQRSSSSESSSSSTSSTESMKKLAFGRLRKFLLLGNEQKRIKDGLKFSLPAL